MLRFVQHDNAVACSPSGVKGRHQILFDLFVSLETATLLHTTLVLWDAVG
jgi:hypothetical protein